MSDNQPCGERNIGQRVATTVGYPLLIALPAYDQPWTTSPISGSDNMRLSVWRLFFRCAAFLVISVAPAAAADVTGTWTLEFERTDGNEIYRDNCSFEQEGDRLSGSCMSGFESVMPVRGTIRGTTVTFRFITGLGEGTTLTFSGELDAAETLIEGTWRFVDPQGKEGGGTFTARKR
jgi:hypothetical protein